MLRRLNDLEGYPIEATNGAIGQVTDFLFDDESWIVRYIVVQTGEWLSDRTVLTATSRIGRPDWSYRTLRVPLTTDQVRNSPSAGTHKPVSRQYESAFLRLHGDYPYYWCNAGSWGMSEYIGAVGSGYGDEGARVAGEINPLSSDDTHLRSTNEVMHYTIMARDGAIGHVRGLLLDEAMWTLRFLIADTGHWPPGHKVLISPLCIQGVNGPERTASINLLRDAIRASPSYDSGRTVQRDPHARFFDPSAHHRPQPPFAE